MFVLHKLLLVFVFATLYWLSDRLYAAFPDIMKNYGFGEIKTEDDFYSYLYFSLITQTTVGYGGVLSDGGQMITTKSVLLKYLVLLQLFSIIFMTGWTLA